MKTTKNPAAVALGSIRTDKKSAASRNNGKMGGRPVKWSPPPPKGSRSNEFYRYTVIRLSDRYERHTDRKPRPEILHSLDFTVWDNRENAEVK